MIEFNVEDKIWLNRCALTLFRKQRGKSKFKYFMAMCQTMQEGLYEQRVRLMLDMMDTADNNQISFASVQNFLCVSFVQDTWG
jgi:Ca2+-binding EF-hand superfamily protein